MKLVVVEAEFPTDRLADATALFETQADAVRALNGCEHYMLYTSGARVAIVQHWKSMDAFDAYRESKMFGELGRNLKPMMARPPRTTIAEIGH